MILIDVNLLIFATFENTVQHRVAREWVKAHFNNSIRVGLPQFVLDCLGAVYWATCGFRPTHERLPARSRCVTLGIGSTAGWPVRRYGSRSQPNVMRRCWANCCRSLVPTATSCRTHISPHRYRTWPDAVLDGRGLRTLSRLELAKPARSTILTRRQHQLRPQAADRRGAQIQRAAVEPGQLHHDR